MGSSPGFRIGVELFYSSFVEVLGESFDDGWIVKDPSYSSVNDHPGSGMRSCRLDSPNSSGERGEGAERFGTIVDSFDGEGLNGGVSSHGEHGGEVVIGEGYVLDEVLYRAIV